MPKGAFLPLGRRSVAVILFHATVTTTSITCSTAKKRRISLSSTTVLLRRLVTCLTCLGKPRPLTNAVLGFTTVQLEIARPYPRSKQVIP